MPDLMTPIYATIPGYPEAIETQKKLDVVPLPVTSGANTPVEQLTMHIMDRLAAGEPLDLLTAAATAMAEVEGVTLAQSALRMAREQLKQRLAELRAANPALILSGLHDALTELVDEVRALHPLHQITSEAGAIASDRTKDFKTLRSLAPRYSTIRREQLRVMRDRLGSDFATDLAPIEALFCRNLPDLFPLWAPWRTHGHLVHDTAARTRPILPPWPVPGDVGLDRGQHSNSRTTFEADASRADFLLWSIEAGAELWVPTLAAYATTGEEHFNRLAREGRTEVIDEHWLDPGGIDVGAPSRPLGHESRMLAASIRKAER